MTISFANNNTQITLTQSTTGKSAIVIDLIFDWCVVENNTTLTDVEILDALQAYYESIANN
jgi:hypothetical protein